MNETIPQGMNHDHRRPDTRPSAVKVWFLAARPKILWAGACPVALGVALAVADGAFHPWIALCTLAASLLAQIGTNYCNDYCDFKKGADTHERQGPTRATQAGWVTPDAMRRATILVFALATLVGLYLVSRGGWPITVIAVASLLSGIFYTAGPYPLGYIGLGDLLVLVFFGPVAVGGTYYLQTLDLRADVLWMGLVPGLWSAALLTVNNLRDTDQDRAAGKRTLAVRFGRGFARAQYVLCVGLAAVLPIGVMAWSGGPRWMFLTLFVLMPAAIPALRAVRTGRDGIMLNPVLGQTARLLLLHTLLLSAILLTPAFR